MWEWVFIIFLCLIPLSLWSYVFSYFDTSPQSKIRFFLGILSGISSLLPIYLFSISQQEGWFAFSPLQSLVDQHQSFLANILFVLAFGVFLWLWSGIFTWIIQGISYSALLLRQSIIPPAIGMFLVACGMVWQYIAPISSDPNQSQVLVLGISISGFASIFLLYLFTSFIEESSKWLHGIFGKSNQFSRPGILFIFVALGFSFIENIFYIIEAYRQPGSNYMSLFIVRSIFSTLLHICCTLFLARLVYAFQKEILLQQGIYAAAFGFILHALYNTSLAHSQTWVILVLLIIAYLLLTQMFYDTRSDQSNDPDQL